MEASHLLFRRRLATARPRRRPSPSRTGVDYTRCWAWRPLREGCESEPEAEQDCRSSSKASATAAQHARSLSRECRRRVTGARRRRRVADRVCDGDSGRDLSGRRSRWFGYGAEHVPRTGRDEQSWTRSDAASQRDACPGKGILGRIRPSLPRRPYEDGHLLQLERCHDVQQHSGGLAAGGGGGHAPRRRAGWSCGSACRTWPGARSGAAC